MGNGRQHFDARTKTEICEGIFARRMTFDEARVKYRLQAYQLWSWLGQHALAKTLAQRPARDNDGPVPPADLARAVGEWVLRNQKL